ncbi:antitoxin VbhA family protein [Corynebacterium urogenitale]
MMATKDYRTEDQKVAAARASMSMAGYTMTPEDEERGRRILRGEISGDEAVLEILEKRGLGNSERAQFLRERIKTQHRS